MHVTSEHVIGFFDVIGLIRFSATRRKWYGVRRSILKMTLTERAVDPVEYAGSPDFSPHRAHRYAHWLGH